MWDSAREQYETEKIQLRQLLAAYHPLMTQVAEEPPSVVELGSLAAMLHAFYTGVENILERVSIEIDDTHPRGDMWHRQLLDQMVAPSSNRPAVLTHEARQVLHEYLRFRHFFRNAYTFTLNWERMAPLVAKAQGTLDRLETELDAFFESAGPRE